VHAPGWLWLAAISRAVASRRPPERSRYATGTVTKAAARGWGRLAGYWTRTSTGWDGPPGTVRDRAAAGLRILPVMAAVSAGCPIRGIASRPDLAGAAAVSPATAASLDR